VQPQLERLTEALESAQSRLRTLSDKLTDSAWSARPAPEHWSSAECVEHLNLTSRAFLPLLRDAVAEARLGRQSQKSHYRRDPLGWFMSNMMGPLRHVGKFRVMRVKTLPPFVPTANRSRTEILSDFVRFNADLVSLLRSADGFAIDEVKIVSPFGGRMRYNAYSAFVIIARHEHRHLQQAEEAALAAGSV
jgi:hypothetical protein